MTIKPKPRHVFTFSKQEYQALDMNRFQTDLAEIRSLPDHEKKKLMGRFIWYPKVLSGSVSYAKILADPQMRNFIKTVTELFPEWLFYLHPKNIFAPVQVFAQLDELLVVEGPAKAASRISAPRAEILTLLLDALVTARAVASSCGVSPEKLAQQVSDVFGIANFGLTDRDCSLVPDLRRPQRKILLSCDDLGDQGIQKVRATFSRVGRAGNRAVFGFEMMVDPDDDLPILYYDSLVKFFRQVFHEIPECFYFLRPNDEGLVGVVNCALQLQPIESNPDSLKWHISATPEDFFMLVMKNYAILRKMDCESGYSKSETLDHLSKTFAGFQLKLCPSLKP